MFLISEFVEIKAPPAEVKKALISERRNYFTVIDNVTEMDNNVSSYSMYQEYHTIFGTAKCSFYIHDTPKEMSFYLMESNCFSKLNGHWKLIEAKNRTFLYLNISEAKLKIIPIPSFLIKKVAVSRIKERLLKIKQEAENDR